MVEAAARAALGQFDQAVAVSLRALERARQAGLEELAGRLERQGSEYRAGRRLIGAAPLQP